MKSPPDRKSVLRLIEVGRSESQGRFIDSDTTLAQTSSVLPLVETLGQA